MSAPLTGYQPIGMNTGFLFAAQAVSSVLRATYAVVLARELGPEVFGLMNYGLAWYAAFLAVANLQLESYMSRQVALSPASASEVLSRAMTLRIFSMVIVFAIAAVSAVNSGEDSVLTTVLLIYAVAMVGRSAAMWCNSAFISRESARPVLMMEVLFRVVEVLVGTAAVLMGLGLIAIALIHALSWWGQSIYGLFLVRANLSAVHFRARLREQMQLFRTVLPVAVASIGATWLMQGPFVLFKDEASVASDVGVVALVLQTFVFVSGIPVALGRAALPALSRTVLRTDNKDAMFVSLVLRAGIAGATALTLWAAAAGPWIVTLIFGDAYRSAGLHLAYGMALVLPFGVATIANQVLIAHDRTWQAMISAVLGAAAMTILVRFFMPAGGAVANYFLCVFAGMLGWAIAALALLSRSVVVSWSRSLMRPALASGLSVGLYLVMVATIGTWGGLAVATLALMAGQWVFNIVDPQEWSMIRGRKTAEGRRSER